MPEGASNRNGLYDRHASGRDGLQQIICKQRLDTALRDNVPARGDCQFELNDEVLMYREKSIENWVAPHSVAEVDGKQITLDTGETMILASVVKVKHHIESKCLSNVDMNEIKEKYDNRSASFENNLTEPENLFDGTRNAKTPDESTG